MGTIAASVPPLGNRHFPLTAQLENLHRFSAKRKIFALFAGSLAMFGAIRQATNRRPIFSSSLILTFFLVSLFR
jgi:hypothetical protein